MLLVTAARLCYSLWGDYYKWILSPLNGALFIEALAPPASLARQLGARLLPVTT
jgi:hypothetical protein